MSIINQPFQGQLGDILKSELSNDYKSFTIFSAFAKNSGVLRLKESMETFKKSGGYIKAFIGIDLDGTSYEALLNLFTLCDELYVIHSESFSTTYHSKIYLLENSIKAWCAIGQITLQEEDSGQTLKVALSRFLTFLMKKANLKIYIQS